MRAGRVCATPGCPEYEPCSTHPKQRALDTRPNSAARGYGAKWKAYSEAYRKRHTHCKPCLRVGRQTLATTVDHIHPVTGPADPLFWKHSNHQSICDSCHAIKTAQEGRTSGVGAREAAGGPSYVFA